MILLPLWPTRWENGYRTESHVIHIYESRTVHKKINNVRLK